ncbi:hypothetical protein BH10ACI4_BH10ACI4_10710 [soil metagenome]
MRRTGLLFLLLCSLSLRSYSEPVAAKTEQGHAAPGQAVVEIKLGESSTELAGPWKFRTGDDLAWAKTDLDDSSWGTMDLTPPPGSADASLGISGYLPGWTERGYPGYSGFAWYRLKVNVSGADRRLALKMPEGADDAYQVFVNGQQIGEFGKFDGQHVTA